MAVADVDVLQHPIPVGHLGQWGEDYVVVLTDFLASSRHAMRVTPMVIREDDGPNSRPNADRANSPAVVTVDLLSATQGPLHPTTGKWLD
jgi:hypothetical protein